MPLSFQLFLKMRIEIHQTNRVRDQGGFEKWQLKSDSDS